MNAYGSLLKKLIRFTNIKLTNLAEIVGYDTSYISKWCNKDKLPAAKASSNVNKCLAGVFAHEIYLQDDVAQFSSEFDVIAPDSEAHLSEMILRLLKDAYKSAYNNTLETTSAPVVSQYRILINPDDISRFFNEELMQIISSLNRACTIYSTMDICAFLNGFDFEKENDIDFPFDINIKFGFNPDKIGKNTDYIFKIYSLLNYYNTIDFDFYDNSNMREMNLIIIKDVLAIQCSLDKNRNVIMATIMTDPREVNTILQKVSGEFTKNKLLIHSTDSNELFYSGYRTEFYSHKNFQLFITRGFEFLLPPEIIPRLIQASVDQGFDSTMQQLIANLGITWEEIFEKGTIDFYLLKTSLLKYVQDGIIYFADVVYKMSTEERKAHIESVLRLTQMNPNIRFHIIDDELLTSGKKLMNISVYNNHKKMFLKNSLRYNNCRSPKFYTIVSDSMIQDITGYMEQIISESCINTYDSVKIKEFYDTFGNMVNRMLSIQE